MSTQDYRKYKKAIEETRKEIAGDREKAREYLYSIGVLTKNGNPKRMFKELCTPEKQA